MEQIKQQIAALEAEYAKLCLQLGNLKANQAKLEAAEAELLKLIAVLDNKAGLLKQSLSTSQESAT